MTPKVLSIICLLLKKNHSYDYEYLRMVPLLKSFSHKIVVTIIFSLNILFFSFSFINKDTFELSFMMHMKVLLCSIS